MSTLSLGQIAKLAGYSRVRIHRFAVEDRIPGKPLKKPPEGQYRYADTKEIRKWCRRLKAQKPSIKSRMPSPRSFSKKTMKAAKEMLDAINTKSASKEDIEHALTLLDSCRYLVSGFSGEHSCTKGVLAILAWRLVKPYGFRTQPQQVIENARLFDATRKALSDALTQHPPFERPSTHPPA